MNLEEIQKRIQTAQSKGNQKFNFIKHDDAKFNDAFTALQAEKTFLLDEVTESDLIFTMVNLTGVKFNKTSSVNPKTNIAYDQYELRGRCLKTNASLITWVPLPAGSEAPELGTQMTFPVIHVPNGHTALQGAEYQSMEIDGRTRSVATKFNILTAVSENAFQDAPRKVAEKANAALLNTFMKNVVLEVKEAVGTDA